MDISPIYELRGRLRSAAIAGTGLLEEDFRLKRAAEAMQPLQKASPVFARIVKQTNELLSPSCKNRAMMLLDVITLVDAVICTLGTVSVLEKTECLASFASKGIGQVITNAPYSVLKTLIEALTTSGSGHYSYIEETHKNAPELFADYRVKVAMVQALGASYADIAEMVAGWLKKEDKSLIPLLKRGFDPKGTKEMVRRVQVIEAIAGAEENAFYLEQLEEAEKDVRKALLYALRLSDENTQHLFELAKSERGNQKKAVLYALAAQDGEEVREYWEAYAKKKPEDALKYMSGAVSDWSCNLAAQIFEQELQKAEESKKTLNDYARNNTMFSALYQALVGKHGKRICACYERAVSIGEPLENALNASMSVNLKPELLELALFLWERTKQGEARNAHFGNAVTAKLLLGGDCTDWLEEQIEEPGFFQKKDKEWRKNVLAESLLGIYWTESGYVLFMKRYYNEFSETWTQTKKPLNLPVKERLTDFLMKYASEKFDQVLGQWIDPNDREYCKKLENWFYKQALKAKNIRPYLRWIERCGAVSAKGLIVQYCCQASNVTDWELYSMLSEMPGNDRDRAEELETVIRLWKEGRIHARFKQVVLDRWLAEWSGKE